MHMMGPPYDAYVYHYLFNGSRLVDVVRMLFSVSYQLTGRKRNLIFCPLKYLIERTACSIQQVDYIE